MKRLKTSSLLALSLLSLSPGMAFASAGFNSGVELQTVQPSISSPAPPPIPKIKRKGLPPSPVSGGEKIVVKAWKITGATELSLKNLMKTLPIGSMTLSEIREKARRIEKFYASEGFPFVRAVIPPQKIENGTVLVMVIEPKYGKISVHNQSRVGNGLVNRILSLSPGAPLDGNELDRSVITLDSLPSTHVVTTLSAGATPGTSDLDVDLLPAPVVTGSVGIDDFGDAYTGGMRLNATASVGNPVFGGDSFSVAATTSGGFDYAKIAYGALLSGSGTRLDAFYSAFDYRIGEGLTPIGYGANTSVLAALGTAGQGQTASLTVTQPIVLRTGASLTLAVSDDFYVLSDTFSQAAQARNDRNLNVTTASLSGFLSDPLGSTSGTVAFAPYFATLYGGSGAANDPYADAAGFRTVERGIFDRKLTLPGFGNSFDLSANGQIASGLLDPVEQFVVGGPSSVRGLPVAVLFGNEGFLASATLAHQFPTINGHQWTISGFTDSAGLGYSGAFYQMSSVGTGAVWSGPFGWTASFSLAVPVGPLPSVVGSVSPVEVWGSLAKNF